MKTFKIILRKISAVTSIMALMTMPLHAQQQQGGDPGHWANIAVGFGTSIFGSIIQQKQQAMQMRQQIQMMNSLAPQTVSARFFQQCIVPASGSASVENVCRGGQPGQENLFGSFVQLASTYEQNYNQMLSMAQHSPAPVGLQCLDIERKKMNSGMVRRKNTISTIIGQLRKEEQAFRDKNQAMLSSMGETYAELHGEGARRQEATRGQQKQSNESMAKNFANYYSPDCREVIGKQTTDLGKSGGLIAIQGKFTEHNQVASNYRSNQANLKRNFDQLTQKLAQELATKGIDDVLPADQQRLQQTLTNITGGNQDFVSLAPVVGNRVIQLNSTKSRIQSDLNELLGAGSFQIPSFGRNFSQDFGRFMTNAEDFFKKKHINECVTGSNSGLSLSADQILSSLQHRVTNNSGNTHILYRQALKNILDSDAFIDDKILRIRQLDMQYRNEVTITYRDSRANTVEETPYNLYQRIIASCEQDFYQDNTYRPGARSIGSASQNESVQRARRLMAELKDSVDSFSSDITKELTDRVQNCNGRTLASNSCSEAGPFSTNSENFCFPHAEACSQKVAACHRETTIIVENKTKEIKDKATIFNQEAEALIVRQQAIMKPLIESIIADAEILAQYFPGADFLYPDELFVPMPEKSMQYGEPLRGGGEITFDALINKLEAMARNLDDQAQKIDREIQEYMGEVRNAILDNQRKWAQVKQTCNQAIEQIASQVQQANAAGQEQQQKMDEDVAKFCRQYSRIASAQNPVAGCGGSNSPEALYDDIHRVAGQINPQVLRNTQRYASVCNAFNNERELGDTRQDTAQELDINNICRSSRTNEDANRQVARVLTQSLPSNLSQYRNQIRDFLITGDQSVLPRAVTQNEDFFADLNQWRSGFAFDQAPQFGDREGLEAAIKNIMPGTNEIPTSGICLQFANDVVANLPAGETNMVTAVQRAASEERRSYSNNARSIASVSTGINSELQEEWARIGQNPSEICESRFNSPRGLGQNPFTLPSGLQLGIPNFIQDIFGTQRQ
jgi:CII-binding regulator of phage lambda lysogenization HflD